MKKIIIILLIFFSTYSYCQEGSINNREVNRENLILYGNISKNTSNDVDGTPFLYEIPQDAIVEGFNKTYQMRYNAVNDEIEFIDAGNKYILFKQKSFGTIRFIGTNDLFKLVDYKYKNSFKTGYLIEISKTQTITLYKKINITYHKVVHATTSFDREIPANYSRNDNTYFIQKNQGDIVELPLNKNKLSEMFPEKKDLINEIFKSKNIDLSKSVELQKFISIFKN